MCLAYLNMPRKLKFFSDRETEKYAPSHMTEFKNKNLEDVNNNLS